jgi:cytochrome c biogenesis protein CcdA
VNHTRNRFVLLLLVAVIAMALAGYIGYVVYPRFDLPASTGLALTGLAVAAGFASFFSPCSFPLLATLLIRSETPNGDTSLRLRSALNTASFIALGAAVFVFTLGLLIAAGGAGLARSVTFGSVAGRTIRGVVGVVLVGLGLIQTGVIGFNLRRFEGPAHDFLGRQARLRRRRPAVGHAMFGFGYLAAGFG